MSLVDEKKVFQRHFIDKLVEAGYTEKKARDHYDASLAMDKEDLLGFLYDTQPEKMDELQHIYHEQTDKLVIAKINQQILQYGLLNAIKDGVEIVNVKLDLIYPRPATSFNKSLENLYRKNRLTVMEEVIIDSDQRVDLVLFLNGLAVVSCELKSEFSGQNFRDAIDQYSHSRDPNNRLFKFKSGTVVNFAIDLNNVYMTTRLDWDNTRFLPFNRGCGEGVQTGAGNPTDDGSDDYPVHYMWDDVLTPDSLMDILINFCYTIREQKTNPETGEVTNNEKLIFPRYHQRDAVLKLLNDVKQHGSSLNYLIQHSAGSGKTNTICWLAHRLSSLHDNNDHQIFNNILIVTDRLVVDQQLQNAVKSIDHQPGLIRAIGEEQGDSSADLQKALMGNTKIIVTTIQKFLYLNFSELAKSLGNKRFAVIIDEAHSSTSGKDMSTLQKALGVQTDRDDDGIDSSDAVEAELCRGGKQPNVSVFAFTATPKSTTLQIFGTDRLSPEGDGVHKTAFHLYSMKQAIEENFILDVLNNYTEYDTFYKVIKATNDDPSLKTIQAKKQIRRIAMLHPDNIEQRVSIIVSHFRDNVRQELDGQAKAMVVTSWREEAVRYYLAVNDYLKKHNIDDIKPLVAFTGKVKLDGDGTEYTEAQLNGFSEEKLPTRFATSEYNMLIVANKYQVGFDQPKLCAMYVLKALRGVNAVQTLSRLNRVCQPYDKQTFILDFVNKYSDIEDSFAPYYTTTILRNTASISELRDKAEEIDGYNIISDRDVDELFELVYNPAVKEVKSDISQSSHARTIINKSANSLIQRTIRLMNAMLGNDPEKIRSFISACRSYVRLYDFLSLITGSISPDLYRKYLFISTFLTSVQFGSSNGIDISKKVNMVEYKNVYQTSNVNQSHISKPFIDLPSAEVKLTKDEEQLLSEIIDDINTAAGRIFDTEVATNSMLQIKNLLLKNDELKVGAQNNSEEDFAFSFYDDADDALLEGLASNKEFFTLLLNNGKLKRRVLDMFKHDVYEQLRKQ